MPMLQPLVLLASRALTRQATYFFASAASAQNAATVRMLLKISVLQSPAAAYASEARFSPVEMATLRNIMMTIIAAKDDYNRIKETKLVFEPGNTASTASAIFQFELKPMTMEATKPTTLAKT